MGLAITISAAVIVVAIVAWWARVELSKINEMSLYEKYSIWTQAVGLAIVFSSVAVLAYETSQVYKQSRYLAYQTSQVAKQFEYNVIESSYNRMASIDEIFVREPELYPYFYGYKSHKEIYEEDELYLKVMSTAMAMANYLEATLPKDGSAPDPTQPMTKYLYEQFRISPALCDYLEVRNEWFKDTLINIMRYECALAASALSPCPDF